MIRVKILTTPNQRKISTICAEYTDGYHQENELTAEIISAIKQPIAQLIESNVVLDSVSSKLAKHDAQIKKEQEENERQRLKAAAAAEKRRLKKQQAEEYIIEKNRQKEINMLLTSLSDELGKSVTLDDIKNLVKG